MLDIGDAPLELMGFKPVAGDGLVLRLVNPTAGDVAATLRLTGLPEGSYRVSRTELDETTSIATGHLDGAGQLAVHFRPCEIQTWKIEPC